MQAEKELQAEKISVGLEAFMDRTMAMEVCCSGSEYLGKRSNIVCLGLPDSNQIVSGGEDIPMKDELKGVVKFGSRCNSSWLRVCTRHGEGRSLGASNLHVTF